jgi:hypothetical protein
VKDPYAAKMLSILMQLTIMIFSFELSVNIPEIVSGFFAGIPLALLTSAATETYLGLLAMATFWALLSGAVTVVSVYEVSQRAALVWVASFAVSSLTAAYCFGRLL